MAFENDLNKIKQIQTRARFLPNYDMKENTIGHIFYRMFSPPVDM